MATGTIRPVDRPTVLEICAGGGGQASGLEAAGFMHVAAIDNDPTACATLRANRPDWRVLERDVRDVSGTDYQGVDVIAGGVPCPPFSIAGKQLGPEDERDMFPTALRLVREARPKAVLLENVSGFASSKFEEYRNRVLLDLMQMDYVPDWKILNASDYGVPQLRPRFILVALRREFTGGFSWPSALDEAPTVGAAIGDLMASRGWSGAKAWRLRANGIAPTIVGGSKKHGGPDLGPTRARKQWAALGVDGISITDDPPDKNFDADGMPRLTVRMVARIQGFSDDWLFSGRKTAAYRQVGNAFPPPVATAVGRAIALALAGERRGRKASAPRAFQPALLR